MRTKAVVLYRCDDHGDHGEEKTKVDEGRQDVSASRTFLLFVHICISVRLLVSSDEHKGEQVESGRVCQTEREGGREKEMFIYTPLA